MLAQDSCDSPRKLWFDSHDEPDTSVWLLQCEEGEHLQFSSSPSLFEGMWRTAGFCTPSIDELLSTIDMYCPVLLLGMNKWSTPQLCAPLAALDKWMTDLCVKKNQATSSKEIWPFTP